jgi:hypothetical protein
MGVVGSTAGAGMVDLRVPPRHGRALDRTRLLATAEPATDHLPPSTRPPPPSHLAKTVTAASIDRHQRAAFWFGRNRRAGSVILHHRTVQPVLVREWSVKMELYAGAIWQSQPTLERFKTPG